MKKFTTLLIVAVLGFCTPILTTSCQHEVKLEAGGAYSDATLATTDQAILDASKTLTGFLDWNAANYAFLARYPEVGALAAKVVAQKDGWIKDAYAARDAYASASAAYRAGIATSSDLDSRRAKLNAALAIIDNITQQILAYKTAHPNV